MPSTESENPYRWWPRYRPGTVELGGAGPTELARTVSGLLLIDGVLALPPVARTIGLTSLTTVVLGLAYAGCMVFNDFVLHPAAMKSPRWFNAQLVIVPIYNVAFCLAFVVLPNDPKSPLWLLPFAYACGTGIWQEIDRSLWLLLLHFICPLLTIPIFLARGADPGWSIAGPVLCSLFSGLFYNSLGANSGTWRRVRAEQNATIEGLRRRAAELERARIARDLHDSVGSVLGLVGVYGDLIERHAESPEQLRGIAATLRDSAREGLGDLRGVLDALAPEATDVEALGRTLERTARRATDSGAAQIGVAVTGDTARKLDGAERLSLVRVFQEAVNNALRHGGAKSIDVTLTADASGVSLQIVDDGRGFSPSTTGPGRGLNGMRERATELSGAFEVTSAPGEGTRVILRLPPHSVGGGRAA